MILIHSIIFNIYSFLKNTNNADNEESTQIKYLLRSIFVVATLITLNFLTIISWFVSWFELLFPIWASFLALLCVLYLAKDRYKRIFSNHKKSWMDLIVIPYIIITIILFVLFRRQL